MIGIKPRHTVAPPGGADEWFTPGRFALFLAAVIVARFPKVIAGRETFFYRDYGLFTYPVAHYFRECFWRDELPLWDPLNLCGIPLLAQWNTAILYPPSLFYLLLPLPWSLGIFNLAHLLLAGMGMYFLARRWTGDSLAAAFAGTAFAFNGLSLHMLMWVSNLAAYAWMPWVVLATERAWREGGRSLVLAVMAGAMQMLAGAPEIIALTWLFLGGLWLAQILRAKSERGKMIARFLLAGVLVTGIAAAQLLPFFQLLANSQRGANFSDPKWAMPAWGWANFIVPLLHCSPSIIGVFSQNEQQWTSSYYLGIGVAALGLVALRDWRKPGLAGIALGALAGIILSMGEAGHVYAWIKSVFPFISVMRYPIKIVTLTAFALPLLAAFALRRDATPSSQTPNHFTRWLLGVGIILLAAITEILIYAKRFPLPDDSWAVEKESGVTRAVLLVLTLCAAWAARTSAVIRIRNLAGAGLLLLLCLDIFTHTADQNPTVPVAAYGPGGRRETFRVRAAERPGESRALTHPQLQSFLHHAGTADASGYYAAERSALFLNCNLIDDISTPGGFFSLELGSMFHTDVLLNEEGHAFPDGLADFAGVSQISSTNLPAVWFARTNFMPLVSGGQMPVTTNDEKIPALMASPEFDPRKSVYLGDKQDWQVREKSEGLASKYTTQPVEVDRMSFSAHRMDFDLRSHGGAFVVIAQAWYPAWHAYVDDQRVNLWRANGGFQAVEVEAGPHHVQLIYEDQMFEIGRVISFLSLLALGGIWVACLKKAKSPGRTAV